MSPARLTAATAAALGGWALLWYLVIHPTAWAAAAALALPALLCVRPAWRGTRLAFGVAGFLAIGYVAHGLTEVVANPAERPAATVSTLLAAALLAAATRALRATAPAAPT